MITAPKFILLASILIILITPTNTGAQKKNFLDREVFIIDNGFEYSLNLPLSDENTVREVLEKSKIEVNDKDIVFPGVKNIFNSETKIIIERATPVFLNIYNEKSKIFTHKKKVREVLIEQEINFGENDLINVSFDKTIFPGIEIRIWGKPEIEPKELEPIVDIKNAESEKEILSQIEGSGETGYASWYSYFGGDYCASNFYPMGKKLLVTNVANSSQVIVTVNDRGPFGRPEFIIDLDSVAFSKIGSLGAGVIKVKVQPLY